MGRVARYKKAKQFQYQINKEPDLLGPEGKNVPPKPPGGDPTKQLPASLRRMMASQEKMKEIEANKGKRKSGGGGGGAADKEETTTTTTQQQGGGGKGKKRKAADKDKDGGKANNSNKASEAADGPDAEGEPDSKRHKPEDAPAEKFKCVALYDQMLSDGGGVQQFEGMRADESYKQFMRRLREQTRAALHEKAMEEKKNLSRARKQKLKEKEEKRKQRKLSKKEGDDFVHHDSVKFGEVVQQPPSLTAKPRIKKSAAAVVAEAMKQNQKSPNDAAAKKRQREQKKLSKEERRKERERRQKMTEEEKERERAQEEKEAREKRAKQLLLARVMESYKQSKDHKKQQLKEMDHAVKRETVHYL